MTERRRRRRPAALPEPATYYDKPESKYPDRVRVSFADGHTEIYDRRVNEGHIQTVPEVRQADRRDISKAVPEHHR